MEKPLILVTNDDGIDSKGLWAAVEAVLPLGEVLVVACSNSRFRDKLRSQASSDADEWQPLASEDAHSSMYGKSFRKCYNCKTREPIRKINGCPVFLKSKQSGNYLAISSKIATAESRIILSDSG